MHLDASRAKASQGLAEQSSPGSTRVNARQGEAGRRCSWEQRGESSPGCIRVMPHLGRGRTTVSQGLHRRPDLPQATSPARSLTRSTPATRSTCPLTKPIPGDQTPPAHRADPPKAARPTTPRADPLTHPPPTRPIPGEQTHLPADQPHSPSRPTQSDWTRPPAARLPADQPYPPSRPTLDDRTRPPAHPPTRDPAEPQPHPKVHIGRPVAHFTAHPAEHRSPPRRAVCAGHSPDHHLPPALRAFLDQEPDGVLRNFGRCPADRWG